MYKLNLGAARDRGIHPKKLRVLEFRAVLTTAALTIATIVACLLSLI
jgi:hypothetical protein